MKVLKNAIDQRDDTTDFLFDYLYFKKNDKLIAIEYLQF